MSKQRRKMGRPKKLQGEGTEVVSVRIHEQIIDQLREAAEAAGHGNLSREINGRLRRSFEHDLYQNRDPAERAICFLLLELMGFIGCWPAPRDWYRYPVLFK